MLVKLLHILSNFKQNENNECVMTIDFTFIIALGKSWRRIHIQLQIYHRLQSLNFAPCACFVSSLGEDLQSKRLPLLR